MIQGVLSAKVCARDYVALLTGHAFAGHLRIARGFMHILRGAALAVFVLPGMLSGETTALRISSPDVERDLGDALEVHVDPTRRMTPLEAASAKYDPYRTLPNKEFTHTSVWVRFKVANPDHLESDRVVIFQTNLSETVEFFDDARPVQRTGVFVSYAARAVGYRDFAFRLTVPPGSERTFYARFDSDTPIFFPARLLSRTAFERKDRAEQLVFGLYYGVAVAMIAYNLFLAMSLRSLSYSFYVAYVAAFALYQTTLNGVSLEHFWPDYARWEIHVSFAAGNLSITLGLLFTSYFLGLRRISRIAWYALLGLAGISMLTLIASQVLPYNLANTFSRTVGSIAVPAIFLSAMLAWRRGYHPARYFVLAWGLFLLGSLLFLFTGLGIVPRSPLTRYAMQLGSAIELVLLSLALGDRIATLRRERDVATARARHIEKELELARRIQTSILPSSLPRLPGVSIAARYIPTAQIGGDYYDFHEISDSEVGVIVADVTGHGVPAALIASMLKISFAHQKEALRDPEEMLRRINTELSARYSHHFVTAGYLYLNLETRIGAYASAGHLPLCVRSRTTGETREAISYGKLLGWPDNFSVHTFRLDLRNGDRLVLYTDGLVEARNSRLEMYGFPRLYKTIGQLDKLSADDGADALIADVALWTGQPKHFEDDLTLVWIDIDKVESGSGSPGF